MTTARPPAVAGAFYPGAAAALRREVDGLLAAAAVAHGPGRVCPKMLIAPHAGYVYSGAVAARAYAELMPFAAAIRRVVLVGPAHRLACRGLAAPLTDAFETPLGSVAVDRNALDALRDLPQVILNDRVHAAEHALEVQLPFLQAVLRDFALVPLAVGEATPAEVAQVLYRLWGGPETLIVISSDLSHYLTDDEARAFDAETVQRVLALQPSLDLHRACGATPLNAALLLARSSGLRPRLLALRNSADAAGDRSRVVGYCAIAFDPPTGVAADAARH
jgi:AmmeMemoRadiSam system protein B